MVIRELDTGNRKPVKDFLGFPFIVQKDRIQWEPLLTGDAGQMLDSRHHFLY